MRRIYVLLAPGDFRGALLEIQGSKFHHLVHVRRLKVGTLLCAVLPDGRVFEAEVIDIAPDLLRAQVTAEERSFGLSPCRITLYQAVLKGEKMDLVVQKASELGVATLVPLLARRSIPHWSEERAFDRATRWQRIADAAAEQCERCVPLQVLPPELIAHALQGAPRPALLLHERKGENLAALVTQHPVADEISLFVGPEGGWDETEVGLMLESGFAAVHLGERILRAETASLVAVTLTQYLWGDLGTG